LFFLLVVGLYCFFNFDISLSRRDCGQPATYQSHPQKPSLKNPALTAVPLAKLRAGPAGTLQIGERKIPKL